jgi:hypothetical protein
MDECDFKDIKGIIENKSQAQKALIISFVLVLPFFCEPS